MFHKTEKLIQLILILFILSLFHACQPENDLIKEPDLIELLTAGDWQRVDIKDQSGNSIAQMCQSDDIFRFYADGAFLFHEGNSLCDPFAEITQTGDWLLNNSTEIIEITISGIVYDYSITEISETDLSLRHEISDKPVTSIFQLQTED